ncbi:MAG TPA: cytochrome C oxidase Cbb3, partial [Polyangiaceae bacterium]|nr:cytochrome C oxidase Cbb3 [Polyangiaceae bacterium]
APAGPLTIAAVTGGNAARGKELVLEYQCNRCHDDTGHEPMARDLHCVHCHQAILADEFPASAAALARWKKTVDPFQVAPSLDATAERLRGDWLLDFLQKPHDLRPNLQPSMPRLALSPADARDFVAYLTRGETASVPPGLARADWKQGRQLLETRGCGSCHLFSTVAPLATRPSLQAGSTANRGIMLAPDLAFVRQRFRPDKLVAWLVDPLRVKPTTLMPATGLSQAEAEHVAAYLLFAPRSEPKLDPAKPRLPKLERPVTYAEVDQKVFRVTCRHCHSNPDIQLGEGGPGNTGGFGFPAKGLNLSSYAAINSGHKGPDGERQSVFAPLTDGTPRLLAAVLARQAEERGEVNPAVRGMPLGLPSLSSEQVQLLETWIAQGRPR